MNYKKTRSDGQDKNECSAICDQTPEEKHSDFICESEAVLGRMWLTEEEAVEMATLLSEMPHVAYTNMMSIWKWMLISQCRHISAKSPEMWMAGPTTIELGCFRLTRSSSGSDSHSLYCGESCMGKPHGKGILFFIGSDVDESFVKTHICDDITPLEFPKSKGALQFFDDTSLDRLGGWRAGYFYEGDQTGKGIVRYNDGSQYDGGIEKGHFQGKGKLVFGKTLANSTRIISHEGDFHGHTFYGEGLRTICTDDRKLFAKSKQNESKSTPSRNKERIHPERRSSDGEDFRSSRSRTEKGDVDDLDIDNGTCVSHAKRKNGDAKNRRKYKDRGKKGRRRGRSDDSGAKEREKEKIEEISYHVALNNGYPKPDVDEREDQYESSEENAMSKLDDKPKVKHGNCERVAKDTQNGTDQMSGKAVTAKLGDEKNNEVRDEEETKEREEGKVLFEQNKNQKEKVSGMKGEKNENGLPLSSGTHKVTKASKGYIVHGFFESIGLNGMSNAWYSKCDENGKWQRRGKAWSCMFSHGERHGFGIVWFKSGNCFKGSFADNCMMQGELIMADGSFTWTGEIKRGMPFGNGLLIKHRTNTICWQSYDRYGNLELEHNVEYTLKNLDKSF
jgi:hypothetical protein